MDKFKKNIYSDNYHNYNYDDLIREELVEEFNDQDIEKRLEDKKYRKISNDSYIPFYKQYRD